MSEFVCPVTRQPLRLTQDGEFLETSDGRRYPVREGIPELLSSESREGAATRESQQYYRDKAREYDHGMDVLFRTFDAQERPVREQMIGLLNLAPGMRVLETGCGTGRDTVQLAGRAELLYSSDVSREMISVCQVRLRDAGVSPDAVRLFVSDAAAVPFPDDYFDAAYHFGGLNEFPDVRRGLTEMVRVVKPGGRVVFGDEGLGPWLLATTFGQILLNAKSLYRHQPPLALLPPDVRDVGCRWIIGGAFYVVDCTVGRGEPPLDLDVRFPGWRGGSHRTRFYGKLDGVAPELRQQAIQAAAREGLPLTDWIEKTLRDALSET